MAHKIKKRVSKVKTLKMVEKTHKAPAPLPVEKIGHYATFKITDTPDGAFKIEMQFGPGEATQQSMAHKLAFYMAEHLQEKVKAQFTPGNTQVGVVGVKMPEGTENLMKNAESDSLDVAANVPVKSVLDQ